MRETGNSFYIEEKADIVYLLWNLKLRFEAKLLFGVAGITFLLPIR
jgi:hypothetical protein